MNFAIDTFPTERLGLITGSRCSPLVPKKSADVGQRTLARVLANEKFFGQFTEVNTWQMEHGKMGEAWAYEHFVKYHDKDLKRGEWFRKGECGASPDAEGEDYGVDFKCPTSIDTWTPYLTDPLDEAQINQCQLYMHLLGKDKWLIAAYLIETNKMTDNGLVYNVDERDRMILVEVLKDPTWGPRFDEAVPRVIAMRDEFIEMYKLKFKHQKL